MTFKYAICYPNKEEIEQRNSPISEAEVIGIAKMYPWIDQLKLADSLDKEDVSYNPSLEFTHIENGKSFTLTANFDESKNLEFSLWYNRPKIVKNFFGLFGKSERMVVDEIWSVKFDDAIKYLDSFVRGNYQSIEKLYEK